MIEFVVVVLAGLVILDVTIELFETINNCDVERYERESNDRLLNELRRHK